MVTNQQWNDLLNVKAYVEHKRKERLPSDRERMLLKQMMEEAIVA